MEGTRYVCPKCGLRWEQKEKKDPEQCDRCHEWSRPFDEAHKEEDAPLLILPIEAKK